MAAVIALIGLFAWAAKRFGFGGGAMVRGGRNRRFGIVEIAAIDAKLRLVLVRRDEVEHLVLVGPDGSTLIEGGIARPALADDASRKEPSL